MSDRGGDRNHCCCLERVQSCGPSQDVLKTPRICVDETLNIATNLTQPNPSVN